MAFSLFTNPPRGINDSPTVTRKSDELSIVFAVESGLVRGTLVLFPSMEGEEGEKIVPHVLHTASAEIAARSENDGKDGKTSAKLLSAMLDSVSVVAEDLSTKGLKIASAAGIAIPISKIHIVFSSPWIISRTKTVQIKYQNDTAVTRATINGILDEERKTLERRFMAEHDASLEFDLAFIEQKIFEIKLNGYPTGHFEGKETRDLEVSFAISVSSKTIINHIEKTVERSVRTAKAIQCHSSLLLQYSSLRDMVASGSDYIAIHIHHEISDVIVVKKGICAGMASFPQGTALLSRLSGAELGQTKEVAVSSLNLHAKKALHPAEEQRIASAAHSAVGSWIEQFIATLALLGPVDSMPHRICLLANAHYSHYERALQENATRKFEVRPIERSIIDMAVAHQNKEREDGLMSLYVFALR